MTRRGVLRRLALVCSALAMLGLTAGGCARKTTAPVPAPALTRTVSVVLTDSLGAPVAGEQVGALGLFLISGTVTTTFATTDGAGVARFLLEEGPWSVAVEPLTVAAPPARRQVAASTFVVPGATRPRTDTLVVHLVLATASSASGTATLAGANRHDGSIVSTFECLYSVATTDSLGSWRLDDLSPGTWTVTAMHIGYPMAFQTVTVHAPGSDVVVPAMQLGH